MAAHNLGRLGREKGSLLRRHRLDEQAAVEEQVAGLATRLGNEQAAVTGGTVKRTVVRGRRWLMVRADRVVRADLKAPQRRADDAANATMP